jgi:protein phosphatase-4 regulatory subunit 3
MRRVCLSFLVAYMLIVVQENIKDVIAHIMLNYEDRIKELSEIRFCGQCFKGFIRRYEMNVHPAPLEVEEKPPPQYVFPPQSALTSLIKTFSSQPMEMRRVDVDEESYFNGDDEDDEDDGVTPGPHPAPTSPLPTLLSPPLSRFQFGQKRRRQRAPGIPLRAGLTGVTQRAPAPATPIHLPRTPPINALVEYGDDDEQSSDPEDALLESLVSKPPASAVAAAGTAISTTPTPPSPISTTAAAGTGGGSGGFVPLRPEKRRRAEEDEDEMGLERLVAGKSKRPTKTGTAGGGEEAPKRIRLRFGAASLAAASSTPPTAARSGSGAKDGDTG